MNTFMKRAIELAIQNVHEGGQPFGAVLVKDNQIITEGVNELHINHDISGHAELLAIRRAQSKLKTTDLSGYTMYASGEPCPMCLSAMYFSGIEQVYYCQTVEDAAIVGLTKSKEIYQDLKKDKANRTLAISQIPLENMHENPMKLFQEKN
ncbi:nucleoside deaminase [Ornithinibacillus scapharcae]|uniref:nucleoside deaminase n=1 Tax=Ornithinibacillus scapharcae TaxID=1147159 RepID=UPI000225B87E|nr:nucleoside deaminase [Ornithinibacillus scapharcae]